MASITIRNLPDSVKSKLKAQAAENGRSMEQEARTILSEAFGRSDMIANEAVAPYRSMRMRKTSTFVSEEEIAHFKKIAKEEGVYASIRSIVDKYGGFDDLVIPPRIAEPFRNPFEEWTDGHS